MDAGRELLKGVIARLKATSGLTALLAGGANGVYGHVPQDALFPYVRVGDITGIDWSNKVETGQEMSFAVHCFAQEKGESATHQLQGLVHGALHYQESALTVSGFSVVILQFVNRYTSPEFVEPQNDSFTHGIMNFRVLLREL